MKRLFPIFFILICLFFAGCDDDSNDIADLSIVSSDVNMSAVGGEGTIEVSSSDQISATSNEDWCSVDVSKNMVHVTVAVNEDVMGRTALVQISGLGQIVSVPVTQGSAVFSVESKSLLMPKSGGERQMIVTSNLPIDIAIDDSWLTSSVSDSLVVFTAEANSEDIPRGTMVTITSGKRSVQIAIGQVAYTDLLGD